jgi:hypothetical protein
MQVLYFLEDFTREALLAPYQFLEFVQMPHVAGGADGGDYVGIA